MMAQTWDRPGIFVGGDERSSDPPVATGIMIASRRGMLLMSFARVTVPESLCVHTSPPVKWRQ